MSEALRPILERLGPNARPEEILDLKVLDPATGSGAFLVEACRQLAARLVDAWGVHGRPADIPAEEDELVQALRQVAQRCLYGVDKNPMAIDLARLSIWLATFAKDHEFTFIDHTLRPGDSLVGLSRQQIENFHWKEDAQALQLGAETLSVREHINKISELRNLIRECGISTPEQELNHILEEVDEEIDSVRWFGDVVLSAFFEEDKPRARERRRQDYADSIIRSDFVGVDSSLGDMEPPINPFHWEIEFPEVFDRENPGFDIIVGNPPFAGHTTVSDANVRGYTTWLRYIHPQSAGKCDVVAHFFRRAFGLLRQGGTLGLIATNTIAQGDTRLSGLRWICTNGGVIYSAQRRIKWPGQAAVVVSVIHIARGEPVSHIYLDGRKVDSVTAFLFHQGGNEDPERLTDNDGKSFQGSIILGMGFTFDDTDKNGIATPIAEMHRLTTKSAGNKQVIFPYIGGQEVNTSPMHAHHRYVIDFGELIEEECWRNWPDVMKIVVERVKPAREESARKSKSSHGNRAASSWWQHYHIAKEMRSSIKGLGRVLAVNCGATPHHAFSFLPARMVFANTLAIFPFESYSGFCTLQAHPHEIWARFFGSSMKDDLRYTPSDCFETFPFPTGWETDSTLESVGKEYYEYRADLMVRNNEGMTKTYNRFHDPAERSPEIAGLREIHTAMDRAVLDAYGWDDIPTNCEFLLDFEIDEEEWGKKKKPWRYRWPDEVRDDVLARLIALNSKRAKEEKLKGRLTELSFKVNI